MDLKTRQNYLWFAAIAVVVIALGFYAYSRTSKPLARPIPNSKWTAATTEPDVRVYMVDTGKIETMKFEKYIQGVVAAEMDPSWPLEALKAQAILARTFAIEELDRTGGVAAKHPGADVSTDPAEFQAYNASRVNDNVRKAVNDTRGQIITYANRPVRAYFHADSGGVTATPTEGLGAAATGAPGGTTGAAGGTTGAAGGTTGATGGTTGATGGTTGTGPGTGGTAGSGGGTSAAPATPSANTASFPYLVSVKVPWTAPDTDWTATFTTEEVRSAAMKVTGKDPGTVSSVAIGKKGPSGRALDLVVGSTSVPAPEFRLAVGRTRMKSTLLTSVTVSGGSVTIKGKGNGHGVGLSQWGAKAMASQGKTASDIITYFYRGVAISSLWK